ncbi:MAG: hypothetical protein D6741_14345 [Planctomycetota bacterium]|nr:MAG: hypothetical protein D6741_14345 [Planctomycetota bacterium]
MVISPKSSLDGNRRFADCSIAGKVDRVDFPRTCVSCCEGNSPDDATQSPGENRSIKCAKRQQACCRMPRYLKFPSP